MKILICDADQECRDAFSTLAAEHELTFVEGPISDAGIAAHSDAEILSVFVSSRVSAAQIDALPHLKLIVARSTGVDHIDVTHAKERNITIVNVPKYGARTVAEYAFALMLTLTRKLHVSLHRVRNDNDFSIAGLEGFDLAGKTLGVVGTGAIGRTVSLIAQAFGMRVLMSDKYPDHSLENASAQYVPLAELLKSSDIVTLHVPYLPENHHLINADTLTQMRRGAIIINTARGELIDTKALLESLKSGYLGGAGLDVLEGERLLKDEFELVEHNAPTDELAAVVRDRVLIELPNVVVTPHVAFFSREAYREILTVSIADIRQFAAGSPVNLV